MKDFLKILVTVIVSLIAGAYMYKCQSPRPGMSPGGDCVTDTTIVYDTIPYIEPAPVTTTPIGFINVTIPAPAIPNANLDSLPDIRADTAELASADVDATAPDSLTLQLPITQNVYEGEDYKAYVSGVYPSLDSMFVYPRHEMVTIKKPPKRWHIGVSAGYGCGRNGFQPYVGIGITYSIFSF